MSHTFTKHKMEKESILRPLFMFWASGYYDKVNAFDLELESMQSTTFLLGFKAAFLSTKPNAEKAPKIGAFFMRLRDNRQEPAVSNASAVQEMKI